MFKVLNTKEKAIDFLMLLNEYVSQYKYSTKFFEYIENFDTEEFPPNCYFTGKVYRKAEKGKDEFGEFHSCSKEKDCNGKISCFHLDRQYYEFDCKNAFDLLEIYKCLINYFNISKSELEKNHCYYIISIFGLLEPVQDRLEREAEVIARVSKKNFKKENKNV